MHQARFHFANDVACVHHADVIVEVHEVFGAGIVRRAWALAHFAHSPNVSCPPDMTCPPDLSCPPSVTGAICHHIANSVVAITRPLHHQYVAGKNARTHGVALCHHDGATEHVYISGTR